MAPLYGLLKNSLSSVLTVTKHDASFTYQNTQIRGSDYLEKYLDSPILFIILYLTKFRDNLTMRKFSITPDIGIGDHFRKKGPDVYNLRFPVRAIEM